MTNLPRDGVPDDAVPGKPTQNAHIECFNGSFVMGVIACTCTIADG
jgi:hypothetical protein